MGDRELRRLPVGLFAVSATCGAWASQSTIESVTAALLSLSSRSESGGLCIWNELSRLHDLELIALLLLLLHQLLRLLVSLNA